MTKLKENQFYCVADRKKVTLKKDDICVHIAKNRRTKRNVPMLKCWCEKSKCFVTKFRTVFIINNLYIIFFYKIIT